MTTLYFEDATGRPVGFDEIEEREELAVGVIDGRFGRWVVDISPDAARCETCETTECDHVKRIEAALASHGLARRGSAPNENNPTERTPEPMHPRTDTQITPTMLDAINSIQTGNHYLEVVAIIRLTQRDHTPISAAEITREISSMTEHRTDKPTRRSLRILREQGIVTVDQTPARGTGHDNRLTDWGWHLAEAMEWGTIARRIDPDAELPTSAPQPPADE